jgi:hypothetical protein
MNERSPIIDPALTSLPAEDRETYVAIVDDILAQYGEEVISIDDVLDVLRERTKLALTRQRHHLKLLIIERLKRQPTPQTFVLTSTGSSVARTIGVTSIVATVFNIPELLESILIYVPIVDLITCRRVNKALHRLIETSPALQRKLFLLPSNEPPTYWGWVRNGNSTEFATSLGSSPPASQIPCMTPDITGRINPLLKADDWDYRSSADETQSLAMLHSTKIDRRIIHSQDWPEMYLTSPPCTIVLINIFYSDKSRGQSGRRLHARRLVRDPAGVTFACVRDALHADSDVTIFDGVHGCLERSDSTVREEIDGYRRRGITLEIDTEESLISHFSVAILTADTECWNYDQ